MQKWPVTQKMMTKRKKSKCIVLNVVFRVICPILSMNSFKIDHVQDNSKHEDTNHSMLLKYSI